MKQRNSGGKYGMAFSKFPPPLCQKTWTWNPGLSVAGAAGSLRPVHPRYSQTHLCDCYTVISAAVAFRY